MRGAEMQRLSPPAAAAGACGPPAGSGWTLVKVVGLPASVLGPLTTTTETEPRPPMANDPRPSFEQNVGGGFWVG